MTLNWVVSLTSSLENTFMVMHVEICYIALELFVNLPKPIGIHPLGIFKRINSKSTDEVKISFVNMEVLLMSPSQSSLRVLI